MLRPWRKTVLIPCVPLLLLGCSPVDDEDEAALGLRSLLVALGPGPANLFPDRVEVPTEAQFRSSKAAPADAFVVEGVDIDCPDGGRFSLDGYVLPTAEDALHPEARDFDLEARFVRCEADGMQLSGTIDYALVVGTSPSEPALAWTYQGDLRLRGDARGTCAIDMQATGDGAEALRGLEVRAYAGTFCDFDAEDVAALASLEGGLAPHPY